MAKKLHPDEAQGVVLGKYPNATALEVEHLPGTAQRFFVGNGKDFLSGWALSEDKAWIDAARRILGLDKQVHLKLKSEEKPLIWSWRWWFGKT